MQAPDYYSILGVSKDASTEEIKKEYRKLALKYHPDRNQGNASAEKKFKEISEAYSVLSDKEKKQQYDMFGTVGDMGGQGFSEDIFESFSDMFHGFGLGDIFGNRQSRGRAGRRSSPKKGSDVGYAVEIELCDVLYGAKKKIQIKRNIVCEKCDGTGAKDENSIKQCSQCDGAGEVAFKAGFMTVVQPCQTCNGKGTVILNPCNLCNGSGVRPEIKDLDIDIPKGISEGTQMKVSGYGNFEKNCSVPGDAYIAINISNRSGFERNGPDLFTVKQIEIEKAILGGKADVPGIDENHVINIPAGIQTHTDFKISGKGLPLSVNASNRGDLYVQVHVLTPTNLSKEAENLIKDFEQLRKK